MKKASALSYQNGFGNYFTSEAEPGTLPEGQNSPQVCTHGLYAEQLSGSAFTAPRKENLRTWLYRRHPSISHQSYEAFPGQLLHATESNSTVTPNQLRWLPLEPLAQNNFVTGLQPMCGSGSPLSKTGYMMHLYLATVSMDRAAFCNADGDLLIIPQQGALDITTEMGRLHVAPKEICVIQRGMHFSVDLPQAGPARGYVLELFEGHFVLPELGPIGANGLANPRDFQVPTAAYEEEEQPVQLLHKLGGQLFRARQAHSPFNVVAWHGNYVPYKYDLAKFCPMNTVRFDHADPSIFTVLTCPSAIAGTAVADLVVFPPRWSVAENTFRPPYFHRNIMSEFMGLICGAYEAKQAFQPGGSSLHVCMTPHGPDLASFEAASRIDTQKPQRLPDSTMAFMFEVSHTPRVMLNALSSKHRELDYQTCWAGFQHAGGKRKADAVNNILALENGHKVQKQELKAETLASNG